MFVTKMWHFFKIVVPNKSSYQIDTRKVIFFKDYSILKAPILGLIDLDGLKYDVVLFPPISFVFYGGAKEVRYFKLKIHSGASWCVIRHYYQNEDF